MLTLEVNLSAVRQNAIALKRQAGCRLCAVVKADAYGHGLKEVAQCLSEVADYFAVSIPSEARQLRNIGLKQPILMLGAVDSDFLAQAAALDVELSCTSHEDLSLLRSSGIRTHIKVDSGMHRLGFSPNEYLSLDLSQIEVAGVYTHFAQNKYKNSYISKQNAAFCAIKSKNSNIIFHAAASGGVMNGVKFCHDMVRAGISLYGYYADDSLKDRLMLRRAMSAHSRLVSVKSVDKGEYIGYSRVYKTKRKINVGVVSCGYGDGVPRALSNRGNVVICGKRYKIIGNICMDMMMVDLHDDSLKAGERVEILSELYTAEDMAQHAGTISYEIITGFSARAERRYFYD